MKDGQTIGEWLNWDFKANGDLEIKDKNGKEIYYEDSNKFWAKWEYDSKGAFYHEDSNKYWAKWELDSQGKVIYCEDSNGQIVDNRIPEIITHTNGRKYKLIP